MLIRFMLLAPAILIIQLMVVQIVQRKDFIKANLGILLLHGNRILFLMSAWI